MTKSPGHQKWPDHQIREEHLQQRMRVTLNGEIIADSEDVIRVDHWPQHLLATGRAYWPQPSDNWPIGSTPPIR